MKLTAVILTKNEEKNIERCLRSISFCDEIVVVDDYSTDKTTEIIRQFNVGVGHDRPVYKIFEKHLNNDFASQRNYGLNKATNGWILFIDADEEVSGQLKKEIVALSLNSIVKIDSFYLRRKDYFWGKELKHGELTQMRQIGLIRLIRKDSGKWLGNVHEVFHTADNPGRLKGYLDHYPHATLKEFINDINYYSTIRSEELYNRGTKTNIFEIVIFPFGKFIYNYFLNLGFLDGPAGFTYAFMMSFHSFLVRTKLYQLLNKQ